MKTHISHLIALFLCILALTGCSCKHTWAEADCVTARTCTSCHATEGEPLGHTPGQPLETPDAVSAILLTEQYCTVCGEQLTSETVPLSTMIQDSLFLFTPTEFVERFTAIATAQAEDFSCELVPGDTGLVAIVSCNETPSLVQFFHADTTPLTPGETDAPVVWCMSLITFGQGDPALRASFFMACDPALDADTAFETDIHLSTAFLNASASGESFGYHQNNGLLYETSFVPEGALGQADAMDLINIYASDFR